MERDDVVCAGQRLSEDVRYAAVVERSYAEMDDDVLPVMIPLSRSFGLPIVVGEAWISL